MLSLPAGLNPKDTDQMEKFLAVLKRLNESPDFNVFIEVMNTSKTKYMEQLASLDTSLSDEVYCSMAKSLANKYQIHDELSRFVSDTVELNKINEDNQNRLDNLDPYHKVTHNKTK